MESMVGRPARRGLACCACAAAAFRADPNYCIYQKGMVRTPLDMLHECKKEATAMVRRLRANHGMMYAHEVALPVRG